MKKDLYFKDPEGGELVQIHWSTDGEVPEKVTKYFLEQAQEDPSLLLSLYIGQKKKFESPYNNEWYVVERTGEHSVTFYPSEG